MFKENLLLVQQKLLYTNSSGISTELNYGLPGGVGGDVQITSINVDSDGLTLR